MKDHIRYIARFLIEAATPLAVGTGNKSLITDAPVAVDVNMLPMIPGTSLCGVLRHSLLGNGISEENINRIFGFQKDDEGEGSRLVVSDAVLVGKAGQVVEGIAEVEPSDEFYKHFFNLPVRQHCRITHRGVADVDNHGKFDGQTVYKGARFVFELKLAGNDSDKNVWDDIIATIRSPLYRIGSGTRKGFGALKVLGLEETLFDLKNAERLRTYLNRSSSLATHLPAEGSSQPPDKFPSNITTYRLQLTPDDFFMFGSGYGDRAVDMRPVVEKTIEWKDGCPEFSAEKTLIPATSVKGAISHRTAFHYNRLNKIFADQLSSGESEKHVGEKNKAVAALFGSARKDQDTGERGKVIFSDVLQIAGHNKILNHVAIDRFTGGAIDGALFSEKVSTTTETINMDILVENSAFAGNDNIRKAFEQTLTDIAEGMLPLGGGVMRGHGVFTGTVEKKGGGEK